MRFLKSLAAITILLCAGCSSNSSLPPTPAMSDIQSRLACPLPPMQLLICVDGSLPARTQSGMQCAPGVALPPGSRMTRLDMTRLAQDSIVWAKKEQERRLALASWLDAECRHRASTATPDAIPNSQAK